MTLLQRVGTASAFALLRAPLLPQAVTVIATIAGVSADVKYAGAAPRSVAGLTQINVAVPAGVTSGVGLPVILKIGSFASTAAATIAVN